MSRWLHCSPPEKIDPARLYKRISNLMCGSISTKTENILKNKRREKWRKVSTKLSRIMGELFVIKVTKFSF